LSIGGELNGDIDITIKTGSKNWEWISLKVNGN